ncbi:hypothetical protein [Corynebacterium lactis]|uniref:Head-to-tail stopper n=1 Tax=Corynebacterium lactis RW2-5 TaxID=1408189 RepID=A0A0K2H3E3_9CORY|nr:hypothetical protein [Corynebacterium lactis]ALA68552.1 hypothetical protein CLAC_07315 [Corynebacterium lactis RW2-5]
MVASSFECTIPIEVLRRRSGGRDAYGNPRPSWERERVMAFAVQVGGDWAATVTHPQAARYDAVVYAPSSVGITAGDRVFYLDRTYEVVEPPGNWDANPWFVPGLVECRCQKMEG